MFLRGWGHLTILKIDRNTGEFVERYFDRSVKLYGYMGPQRIFISNQLFTVSTCNINGQILFGGGYHQPYTITRGFYGVHDETPFDDEDYLWVHNDNLDHVRAYGPIERNGVKYAIVYNYGDNDTDYQGGGLNLHKLPEDKGGFFQFTYSDSNWLRGEVIQRAISETTNNFGGLFWYLLTDQNFHETSDISFFYYKLQIYFKFSMYGWSSVTPAGELWRYIIDEGYTQRIDCIPTGDVVGGIVGHSSYGGYARFTPNANWGNCKYFIGDGKYAISTFVDTTPPFAVYKMITKILDGIPSNARPQIDIDLNNYDSDCSFNSCQRHCLEVIPNNVQPNDKLPGFEPRYLYSNIFTKSITGFDMLRDALQVCGGFLTICNNKIIMKIPRTDEKAVFFFGYDQDSFFVERDSNDDSELGDLEFDIIYIDFSLGDYPDDYWNGDFGVINIDGEDYEFIVIDQTETYIKLAENLPTKSLTGSSVILKKDNIKKSSFNYWKKSRANRANKVQLEYMERTYPFREYEDQVVETEYLPGIIHDIFGQDDYEQEIIKSVEMPGIKRTLQA